MDPGLDFLVLILNSCNVGVLQTVGAFPNDINGLVTFSYKKL